MLKINKAKVRDKKKILQESGHLTRPPRLEGKTKNAMMNPKRKQKSKRT